MCALLSLTAIANAADSKSNWSETYYLKNGSVVTHTPSRVCYDGFLCAGQGLHFNTGSNVNGTIFGGCGLHLVTDSSKAEFESALNCSGLY